MTRLLYGDARYVLPHVEAGSIDAVVTDPPYGLEFMGKEWDSFGKQADVRRALRGETSGLPIGPGSGRGSSPTAGRPGFDLSLSAKRGYQAWCESWAVECYRVMKPGAYLVAFGGSRTWHRLASAVEDAGFEIRDSIAWLYGSGFPKSLNVAQAIDKATGTAGTWEREDHPGRPGTRTAPGKIIGQTDHRTEENPDGLRHVYRPGGEGARWEGFGTALKPAFEPIVVARKPLEGTVANNVLTYGVGALNIDASRIPHAGAEDLAESAGKNQHATYGTPAGQNAVYNDFSMVPPKDYDGSAGRWPANVVLDADAAGELDVQGGVRPAGGHPAMRSGRDPEKVYGPGWGSGTDGVRLAMDGAGSASRYFLVVDPQPIDELTARFYYTPKAGSDERVVLGDNMHPTVKPLALTRWLTKLVCPPGGHVLDLFGGSGTTAEACLLDGFDCTIIEKHHPYLPLIRQRINRRLDPVEAVKASGHDAGLFDLL